MVRTLVFHTNNVGSIPTGLNMNLLKVKLIKPKIYLVETSEKSCIPKHIIKEAYIRYEFRFVSLIPPYIPSFINSKNIPNENPKKPVARRPFLKRSYLLLSWFHYLASDRCYVTTTRLKNPEVLKIAILPAKQNMYTLTKAPMAHKTNSKEQYLFKFYNFKFSINLKPHQNSAINSCTGGAYVLDLTSTTFPFFETNLLFLKYYKVNYPIRDTIFFANIFK